jgi:chemotaxis protein methyltransferase CheR
VLAKLRRVLRPDGYLLLGAAETTMNLDEAYHREVFARTGSYYRLGR